MEFPISKFKFPTLLGAGAFSRLPVVLLLILLLTACAGYPLIVTPDFSALTPQPTATLAPQPTTPPAAATPGAPGADLEEDFARGAYALCVDVMTSSPNPIPLAQAITTCRQAVEQWLEGGAYGREPPGWQWPLNLAAGDAG